MDLIPLLEKCDQLGDDFLGRRTKLRGQVDRVVQVELVRIARVDCLQFRRERSHDAGMRRVDPEKGVGCLKSNEFAPIVEGFYQWFDGIAGRGAEGAQSVGSVDPAMQSAIVARTAVILEQGDQGGNNNRCVPLE